MTTKMKAELRVVHDGIRANATILVDVGEPALRACTLDAVLEAALQDDADLAADYASILRQIAPELYLVLRKEKDGSRDNGACWYVAHFSHGINGDILTTRGHRLGGPDFRGWTPSDAQTKEAETAILATAARVGLANAQYWRGTKRTVAENVR